MHLARRPALSLCHALLLLAVMSPAAFAHPGHAHPVVPAASPWHYWLQPEHALINGALLAALVGVLLTAYTRWQVAQRVRRMTPLKAPRTRR